MDIKGVKVVETIINKAVSLKIKYLTLYTFSTETEKDLKKRLNFYKFIGSYIKKELKIW